jgi:hypothetical protein
MTHAALVGQQLSDTTSPPDVARSARWLAAGVLGGFVSGALIGGVGGRVAMFVLRLTSDPSLHGLETDDGFTIGVVSPATLFLILITAFLGLLGGILYLVVRGWLPERWRPAITGTAGAIVGGAGVIRPDGLDFTLLDPLPLAVAMFIAIPAAYGVAMSLLTERLLREDSILHRSRAWVLGLVVLAPLALTNLGGFALLLVIVGVWLLHWRIPALGALWHSPAVTWIGRGTLAAIVAFNLVELVDEVSQVL